MVLIVWFQRACIEEYVIKNNFTSLSVAPILHETHVKGHEWLAAIWKKLQGF